MNIADDIAITRRHLPLFYYVKEQCNFLSQIQKFILKKEKLETILIHLQFKVMVIPEDDI